MSGKSQQNLILTPITKEISKSWLLLSLAAFSVSSIFALILVILRTPFLAPLLPETNFFRTALTLHVNYAVIIWFLAFAGTLWGFASGDTRSGLAKLAEWAAATGAMLMLLSAIFIPSEAISNNYLPVLHEPIFLGGLLLFASGIVFMAIRTILHHGFTKSEQNLSSAGMLSSAIALIVAMLITGHAFWTLPAAVIDHGYFEALFWGGGHMLQFTHTLLMLTVWLSLARVLGIELAWTSRTVDYWFMFGLLPVLLGLLAMFQYPPYSIEYRLFFTALMVYGSWIAVPAIAGGIVIGWWRQNGDSKNSTAKKTAAAPLAISIFLFCLGILVGTMIETDSVIVTAHYHGTVGSITLAYMGWTFYLLSRLGFTISPSKLVRLQPLLYGFGMLLLIVGLAWSGLHGTPRKTTWAEQLAATLPEKGGMVLMGMGGLIALFASLIFLYIAFGTIFKSGQKSE